MLTTQHQSMSNLHKKILFKIYEILDGEKDEEEILIGVRVMNDHRVDPEFVSKLLYSIFYRYLSAIDDNDQLSFTTDIKRRFTRLIKEAPSYIDVDEEDIENIEDIEEDDDDDDEESEKYNE